MNKLAESWNNFNSEHEIGKFWLPFFTYINDIYEPLNRTHSRQVWVAAASGLDQEFEIVLSTKVKIENGTSSVYSRLYDISAKVRVTVHNCFVFFTCNVIDATPNVMSITGSMDFFDQKFLVMFVDFYVW